ncbi:MAG: energy-coupling factor transporter transmembrane component T [bacterium]|nr:energy-coupling factor transporter transmembrane component T [bacterium]
METAIDQRVLGHSAVHRMDGRLKLLGFACFLCATAVLRSLPALAAAFFAAWCWVLLARLPLAPVLRRTGVVVLFLGTFFLILPFSHPLGADAGLQQAAVIVLKGASMIVTIFPMFHTAPFHVSIKALECLKLSPKLVALSLLTYRYVAAYQDQIRTVRIAMKARGFHPGANLRTLGILGDLIGSLLIRSFEQTERIYQAMRSRGYRESFGVRHEFQPLKRSDWFKFSTMILMSVALVGLDFKV